MNGQLELELANFRDITKGIINVLDKDEFDNLDELFDSRQIILDKIDALEYTHQEFTNLCEQYNILKYQQQLEELLGKKRSVLKGQINKLSEQKQANRSYSSQFSVDSIYFNKKL